MGSIQGQMPSVPHPLLEDMGHSLGWISCRGNCEVSAGLNEVHELVWVKLRVHVGASTQ